MLISQGVNSVIMRNFSAYYFCVKTKLLVDFYICISVPLKKFFFGLLSVCAIGNFGESLVSNSKGHINV